MDTSRGHRCTVLLGDSHLAYLRIRMPGSTVLNSAVPGVRASDVLHSLRRTPVGEDDECVLSVGTNDLAPWKQVPIAAFESALAEIMDLLAAARSTGLITLERDGMQATDGVHLNDVGHARLIEAITVASRGSGRFRTIRA